MYMNAVMDVFSSGPVTFSVLCAVIVEIIFIGGNQAEFPVTNHGTGECCVPCSMLHQVIPLNNAFENGGPGTVALTDQSASHQQLEDEDYIPYSLVKQPASHQQLEYVDYNSLTEQPAAHQLGNEDYSPYSLAEQPASHQQPEYLDYSSLTEQPAAHQELGVEDYSPYSLAEQPASHQQPQYLDYSSLTEQPAAHQELGVEDYSPYSLAEQPASHQQPQYLDYSSLTEQPAAHQELGVEDYTPYSLAEQQASHGQLQDEDYVDNVSPHEDIVGSSSGNYIPDYSMENDYHVQPQTLGNLEFEYSNQMQPFIHKVPVQMQPQVQDYFVPRQQFAQRQENDNKYVMQDLTDGNQNEPSVASYMDSRAKSRNPILTPRTNYNNRRTLMSASLPEQAVAVASDAVRDAIINFFTVQSPRKSSKPVAKSRKPVAKSKPVAMAPSVPAATVASDAIRDAILNFFTVQSRAQGVLPPAKTPKIPTLAKQGSKNLNYPHVPLSKKTDIKQLSKPTIDMLRTIHNLAASEYNTFNLPELPSELTNSKHVNVDDDFSNSDDDLDVDTMSADFGRRGTPLDRLVKEILKGTGEPPITKYSNVRILSKNAQKLLKFLYIYTPRMYSMSRLPTIPRNYLPHIPDWFPFVNGQFDTSIKDTVPSENKSRFKPTDVEDLPEPYRRSNKGAKGKDKDAKRKVEPGAKAIELDDSDDGDDDSVEILVDSEEAKEVKEAITHLGKLDLSRKTDVKKLSINTLKLLKFLQVTLPKMYAETDLPIIPPKVLMNVPEWYPGLDPLNIKDDKKYTESAESKKGDADSKPTVMSGEPIPRMSPNGIRNLQGHVFGSTAVAPVTTLRAYGNPQQGSPRYQFTSSRNSFKPNSLNAFANPGNFENGLDKLTLGLTYNFRENQNRQLDEFSRQLKAATKKFAHLFPGYGKMDTPKLNSIPNNYEYDDASSVDQFGGENPDAQVGSPYEVNALPSYQPMGSNDYDDSNLIENYGTSPQDYYSPAEAEPMSQDQSGEYDNLKTFYSTSGLKKTRGKKVDTDIDKVFDETLKEIPLFNEVDDSKKLKKTDKNRSNAKDGGKEDGNLGKKIDKMVDDALTNKEMTSGPKVTQESNAVAPGEDRRSEAERTDAPGEVSRLAAQKPQDSNMILSGGGSRSGTIVGNIFSGDPSHLKPGIVYHSKKEKVNEKKSFSSTAESSSKVKYIKKKERPKT